MLQSQRVGGTGGFEGRNFRCALLDIGFGGAQNISGINIDSDIRLRAERGLQITIMAVAHTACGNRDRIIGGRLGLVEFERLAQADHKRPLGDFVLLQLGFSGQVCNPVMRGGHPVRDVLGFDPDHNLLAFGIIQGIRLEEYKLGDEQAGGLTGPYGSRAFGYCNRHESTLLPGVGHTGSVPFSGGLKSWQSPLIEADPYLRTCQGAAETCIIVRARLAPVPCSL
ncbi:hypothetical protein D3C73_1095410 [compost metagenome]